MEALSKNLLSQLHEQKQSFLDTQEKVGEDSAWEEEPITDHLEQFNLIENFLRTLTNSKPPNGTEEEDFDFNKRTRLNFSPEDKNFSFARVQS